MRALAAAIPAEQSMPGPPAYPHTRFRMAAISAIVMTIASFGMIRDEAPVVASGTLTGADGKPIVGATVELRSGRQRDAVALSDEHGRWWLSGGHRIDIPQQASTGPIQNVLAQNQHRGGRVACGDAGLQHGFRLIATTASHGGIDPGDPLGHNGIADRGQGRSFATRGPEMHDFECFFGIGWGQ